MKILIADDHPLIREGFKKILSREVGLTVVGEASNAGEVLSFLRNHPCDLVVLDINMPGRSGLEVLEDIRRQNPEVKILILSIHPESRFAIRALKAGAAGYLTKDSAPEELVAAIRKIQEGRKYISPNLAEHIAYSIGPEQAMNPHDRLSNREMEVFLKIAAGKTIQEIAQELNLSASTINTYRNRILEKMGLKSNAEIIHYALRNHLLD
ncbi:MAG: DNA-binding response regulator [Calditrichaeota bacterium]|nr:MAG: DNA-binding response regulator [Calditrichota bacterium]